MFRQTVFPNGLRVAAWVVPEAISKTAVVNLFFRAGSRCETKDTNGSAHGLEHLLFDGSGRYSEKHAGLRAIEALGGQANAVTSKEIVGYWAEVLSEDIRVAFDVISDAILNPLLTRETIERERGPLLRELRQHFDKPPDYAQECAQGLFFGNHALGRSVMGSQEFIQKFCRTDLLHYLSRWYFAENAVLVVTGNISSDEVFGLAESFLCQMPRRPMLGSGRIVRAPKRFASDRRVVIEQRATSTAYVHLTMRGVERKNRLRPALSILTMIMGGTASSRLFRTFRTERDLVYDVTADMSAEHDYGIFELSFGVDPKKLFSALALLMCELKDVRAGHITQEEFTTAKKIREFDISKLHEGHSSMGGSIVYDLLMEGSPRLLVDRIAENNSVTIDDVRAAAQFVLNPEDCTLAVVGPVKETEQELLDIIQNA